MVKQRQSDLNVWSEVIIIVYSCFGPDTKIQNLSIPLRDSETVKAVLMRRGSSPSARTAQSSTAPNNVQLNAGAPAECVAVDEAFERRLKSEADEMQRQIEKESDKIRKQRDRLEQIESQKRMREEKERDRLYRQLGT